MYRRLILLVLIGMAILFNSLQISSIPMDEKRTIDVEIRGEVDSQGIYQMELGSTYGDLFSLAGISDKGDISSFSMQKKLMNRELIVVPAKEEVRLISINSASLKELCTLPGIGETIAERIIAYRSEVSPFLTLEDLMNVKGIGRNKYEKLKDCICL